MHNWSKNSLLFYLDVEFDVEHKMDLSTKMSSEGEVPLIFNDTVFFITFCNPLGRGMKIYFRNIVIHILQSLHIICKFTG